MDYLALPLQLNQDTCRLERTGAEESIRNLIEASFFTPPGPWCGYEHFGIADLVEDYQRQAVASDRKPSIIQDKDRAAARKLNYVIEKLAGPVCTIESVTVTHPAHGKPCVVEAKMRWKNGAFESFRMGAQGAAP